MLRSSTDNTLWSIPDFSFVAYEGNSVYLDFFAHLSKVKNSNITIIEDDVLFYKIFDYENTTTKLTQLLTTNRDVHDFQVYSQLEANNGTLYQTNKFNVSLSINFPPSVVSPLRNYTFYLNQLNRTIEVPPDLFTDDENFTVYVDQCYTIINQRVGLSIPKYDKGKLVSFDVYFNSTFIGNWTMSLLAIDGADQTSATSFRIFVRSCAQTDWIAWNSEYQSSWFRCADGYELEAITGEWLWIGDTIKNYGYGIIFYILMIFMIFLKIEIFISIDYILYNQLILFFWLMNSQATGVLNEVLNSIQYIKFDLKFLDYIFNSRNFVNRSFLSNQQRNLTNFHLYSGSTFANFINLLFVEILMIMLYLIFSVLK